MTLQAKLTLGSVLLATLIVAVISAVDLGNVMQLEFDSTLEHAQLLKTVASDLVQDALNRQPTKNLLQALHDPDLSAALVNILSDSHTILEVAVVNLENEILADSDQDRVGLTSRKYKDFQELVKRTHWYDKLKVLALRDPEYYQLEQLLGTTKGQPLLYVRVIIAPALIYDYFKKSLKSNVVVSLLSLIGAVVITFLASAIAFRPLGQIGHMLDLAASGGIRAGESHREQTAGQGGDGRAVGDGLEGEHPGTAAAGGAVRGLGPAR
ncbi:MAG: cell wall metabolism sensor histidine kinase WalK [Acidobacteriia bacterium]|nr:cell wall metabolism sensor histidine kinase WalK [Terriglobia bacterium]